MDDRTDPMTPGDQELERRLEAYADARLSPSPDSTTRTRVAVMAAAHRQAAGIAADAVAGATEQATSAGVAATPKRGFWKTWRRPVVALVAASLIVGIVAGSALASRAGGPLYAARLWAEMVTLPADPLARAEAETKRLQARIGEAQEASAAGDSGATEAALVAYSTIVVAAAKDSAGDATARATIEATVQLNVTVLIALVDSAPASARAAAQEALDQSNDTLRNLRSPGGSVNDPASNPNAGRGGNGAPGSKGDGTDAGDSTGPSDGCAPTTEPSDDAVAALDGDSAACDPSASDRDPGTTGASDGKAVKPAPTARPTDKTAPAGHRETNVPAQPVHHVRKPDPAPNVDEKGSPIKAGQSQAPEPCESPKPGPDAHKP